MTVREFPWPQTGAATRWVRAMLVTLCAVIAVLLHHGLSDSPATAMPTAPHVMPGPVSAPAAHLHTVSPAAGVAVHGFDGASCPSMAMQLCTAAGVNGGVQLTAPSESAAPPLPPPPAARTGVGIARSVNRAPPDLSLLSPLRI